MCLLPHLLVLPSAAYLRKQAILVHYPQYCLRIEIQGLFPHKPYLDAAITVSFSAAFLTLLNDPGQNRIPFIAVPAFHVVIISAPGYLEKTAHNRYRIFGLAAVDYFVFE